MFSTQRVTDLLNGSLKDAGNFCYGICNGYYTVLRSAGRTGVLSFVIGTRNDADPGNSSLLNYLLQVKEQSPKMIKGVGVTPFSCYIEIAFNSQKKFIEYANAVMGVVYRFLTMNRYITCCSRCGKNETEVACYNVNGVPAYLCQECIANDTAVLEGEKSKRSTQKSNFVPGLVGALGGMLIGVALYVLIARLGLISALGGVVMAVLAIKGYEWLGGCLDVKGAITCIIAVAFGAWLGNRIDWVIDAYIELKDYDWSLFECFREIKYIIEAAELTSEYYGNMVLAFVFTALGSLGTLIPALKNARGGYKVTKYQ